MPMPLFVNQITIRIAGRTVAIAEQRERGACLNLGTTLSRF
jgi:hypothetical protein